MARIALKRKDCPNCEGTGGVFVVEPSLLRQRRESGGWTLEQISQIAEVSIGHLSDVELGHRSCTEKILKVYEGLKVPRVKRNGK